MCARTSTPMCVQSCESRPNRISGSNDYSSNFVIPSQNLPTETGFAHSTIPNSAQHQTPFPYFLHSPPRPPQTAAASFKSRYRKSSAVCIRLQLHRTRLGLPINARDFKGLEGRFRISLITAKCDVELRFFERHCC